ncbi:LTA synthase family protein [Clostridium paridis]|uniref:LTA synthase family protein n=1 Tax=Clostridium paridis TaxID=2803863 RepID=A0A937K378_9CLOT|nr:LTA synthase family protein [Clostridium paridis]MBL4930208.1 LTA synthase family protein [Clostridium paridis]
MNNRKFIKYIDVFAIITYILLVIKSDIYLAMIRTNGSASIDFKLMYFGKPDILAHLVFPLIVVSFSYLFKGKGKIGYNLIINTLISIFFIADIWYYRSNGTFLSISNILYPSTFNPLHKNLFNFKPVDLIFVIDIFISIILIIKTNVFKKTYEVSRSIIAFIVLFLLGVGYTSYAHYAIDVADKTKGEKMLFRTCWAPFQSMSNMSPLGYHAYDIYEYLVLNRTEKLSDSDKTQIANWFEYNNENLPDNKYKGMLQGKNLIAIQVESLENFVIGQKAYGQEITPNLNRLLSNSLYFSGVHEQNNSGTSSDADFMINTSVFPIREGATFFRYPQREYTTLAELLKDKGYNSLSTHPEVAGNWNWAPVHQGSLKFDKTLDITSYNVDEVIGLGLSDQSYLNQVADKLTALKQPFYGYMVTLTSHGPFDIPDNKKLLKLPEEFDKTILGSYFQSVRYTDEAIGNFIKKLDSEGVLKNSVIMIYGDHTGVHKFYPDKLKDVKFEGNWWQPNDMKIPYIIYNPSINGEEFKVNGGGVDILPTISYLLGVDRKEFGSTSMGRVLVNTNRDATVLNSGEIIGTPKDAKEEQHLKETLDVANKVVLGNYFSKK